MAYAFIAEPLRVGVSGAAGKLRGRGGGGTPVEAELLRIGLIECRRCGLGALSPSCRRPVSISREAKEMFKSSALPCRRIRSTKAFERTIIDPYVHYLVGASDAVSESYQRPVGNR